MRSLVVLLDESAPSFCYYEPRASASPRRMSRETFGRVLAFADQNALSLQLVSGRDGVDPFVADALGQRPYTRFVPLGSPGADEDDVLVVDGTSWDAQALGSVRHRVCVLRVAEDGLAELPGAWERLSKHAYRIVLVATGLDRYDEAGLRRYEAALLDLRQRLAAKYLRGEGLELSVISDRLALRAPSDCGAGVDHLTVTPGGDLHLCPGFAMDGAPPVGSLSGERRIENAELLLRDRAPICGACDAYQCRRCVYMNRRATLELNTPPWQVCRAAHAEREASRVMLESLHRRRCLEAIGPIPPLDYADPLDPLMQVRHGIPRGVSASPAAPTRSGGRPVSPSELEPRGGPGCACGDRRAGRVTPEERDEIEALYRRKLALTALLPTLARMDSGELQSTPLYERLVRDLGETIAAYDAWWAGMAASGRWRRERPDQTWHIDFDTCDVLLDGGERALPGAARA